MSQEQCPSCGYTEDDAKLHGDHRLCKNDGNAPWQKKVGHCAPSPTLANPPAVVTQGVEYRDTFAVAVEEASKPAEEAGAREWREIVDRVANDAINLAVSRHDMEWDEDLGTTLPEIVQDAVNCLTGDDIGCGEESDAGDPEKCAGAFVRGMLDAYAASQTAQLQAERDALLSTIQEAREATSIVRMQDYADLDVVQAVRKLYGLWMKAIHDNPQVASLSAEVERLKQQQGRMPQVVEELVAEKKALSAEVERLKGGKP
jgi:hypothetical protein